MDDTAELAQLAARRSGLYWLLAELVLSRPEPAIIESLCNDLPRQAADATSSPVIASLTAMRDALPTPGNAVAMDALAAEYTRLFGGIKSGYGLPPPYESVHRSAGDPSDLFVEIVARYGTAGFPALGEAAAPPDHLGVEFKFIALLCHKEMEAWRVESTTAAVEALRQQRDFLDEHLLKWAPQFWALVKAQAQHPFYRVLAAMALDAITEDRALLEEMLVEFDTA